MLEWLQNPIVSIAFAIGLMFFGYFFGLFEGRGQGYKRRQEEEAEKKETAPVIEGPPPASPTHPLDEIPMLDVSKNKGGQLRLMLDGQHTDPSTLSVNQRKRLIEILTLMRPWLESPKSAQPAQGTPPPAQPRPASSPRAARPSTAIPSPEPAPTAASRPAAPASSDEDSASAASANSIVAQIDSILQAHIAGTPLVEKGIRLQESPEGGVIVWVGINKFQGIEDVPDEQIKAAIRAAIAKWESKYTPGA